MSSANAAVISRKTFENLAIKEKSSFDTVIGAISIHDITRALEPKKILRRQDVRDNLPMQIQKFTDLFVDDDAKKIALSHPIVPEWIPK